MAEADLAELMIVEEEEDVFEVDDNIIIIDVIDVEPEVEANSKYDIKTNKLNDRLIYT